MAPQSLTAAQPRKDDLQDILEDVTAIGNQAIGVLMETTDSLSAAEDDLHKTRQALENHLYHEELVYQGGIIALLKATEAKDETTGHHIGRMVLFSLELSRLYGISDLELLKTILFTSALHDIGKVGIRDEVLNKPGPLTPEEREHIQTHPVIGAKVVASLPGWEDISLGVMAHHERWDGAGYPNGWAKEQIPLAARIVAVADVFDAVTSLRPYRDPFPYYVGRVHIEKEAGHHFDPEVVDVFLKVSEERWEALRHMAEQTTLEALLQNRLTKPNLQLLIDEVIHEDSPPLPTESTDMGEVVLTGLNLPS